jgi:chromosome segregation ATPase
MARAALVKAQENEAAIKRRFADSSSQVEELERTIGQMRAQLEDRTSAINPQQVASKIAELEGTLRVLVERRDEDKVFAENAPGRTDDARGEILAAEADIEVSAALAKKGEVDQLIAATRAELGQRLRDLQASVQSAIGKVARVPERQRTELLGRLPAQGGGLVSELMQSDMNRPDHLSATIAGLLRGRM